MKIYISADFEGINGVARFSQTELSGGELYKNSLKQLHKEINAVIKGAEKAGVNNITINDAHSSMSNICLENIAAEVQLVTGKPKPISMMAGLDESFNAAILLGYHAKAGTPGACLAHTFSDDIYNLKINGLDVGEAYINSMYAATLNIPILLVTGDEAFTEEVYNQIGSVPAVVTKKSIGMYSNISSPNSTVLKELEDKTYQSLCNPTNWILNKVNSPYTLELEFTKIVMADLVELMPGIERIGSRKIKFTHSDFSVVYKVIQASCALINTSINYF